MTSIWFYHVVRRLKFHSFWQYKMAIFCLKRASRGSKADKKEAGWPAGVVSHAVSCGTNTHGHTHKDVPWCPRTSLGILSIKQKPLAIHSGPARWLQRVRCMEGLVGGINAPRRQGWRCSRQESSPSSMSWSLFGGILHQIGRRMGSSRRLSGVDNTKVGVYSQDKTDQD